MEPAMRFIWPLCPPPTDIIPAPAQICWYLAGADHWPAIVLGKLNLKLVWKPGETAMVLDARDAHGHASGVDYGRRLCTTN